MEKVLHTSFAVLLFFMSGPFAFAEAPPSSRSPQVEDYKLDVVWVREGVVNALKSWKSPELNQFKRISSTEKDPVTEELVRWQGVSLVDLVDKALETLTPENRAHIDLIILKNAAGDFAPIPRFVIKRYPLMLAFLSGTPFSASRGPLYSIIPWSSRPHILKEILPLERYFLPRVSRIELVNDEELNRPLFLKRRTDPSAIRGEKLFVQSCSLCHSLDRVTPKRSGELAVQKVIDFEKPLLSGNSLHNKKLILQEKDRKSILRYLNAYEAENLSEIKKAALPRLPQR